MSDKPASPARGRKKTAPPAQQPPQEEVVVRLPLTDLYPFPDHPFQVRDDEEMRETIQSVKEYGVIVPAIVRPREEGGYSRKAPRWQGGRLSAMGHRLQSEADGADHELPFRA